MLKFFKKSILFAVSGSYRSLLLILLLPLWVNYFSPAEIGIFAIVLTTAQILARLGSLGLVTSVSRFYIDFEEDDVRFNRFFSSVVGVTCVSSITIILLSLFARDFLAGLFLDEIGKEYWWCVIVLFIAFVITNFQMALYTVKGYAAHTALIIVISQTVGVLTSIGLVIFFSRGLEGRFVGLIAGEVIAAVFCLVVLARVHIKMIFSSIDAKLALAYGLPLMLHSVSQMLLQSGDRYVLLKLSNATNVGLYSVATSFVAGLLLLQGAANQTWAPNFLRILKARGDLAHIDGEKMVVKINSVFNIWVLVFSVVAVCMILFGLDIIKILAPDPSYHGVVDFLPPLVLGAYIMGVYFFGVNVVMYLKKTKLIPIVTGGCMLLNIGANILCVPYFGASSAAWSTLLCNFILCGIFHYYARGDGGVKFEYRCLAKSLIVIIITMVFVSFLSGVDLSILQSLSVKLCWVVIMLGLLIVPILKNIKLYKVLILTI